MSPILIPRSMGIYQSKNGSLCSARLQVAIESNMDAETMAYKIILKWRDTSRLRLLSHQNGRCEFHTTVWYWLFSAVKHGSSLRTPIDFYDHLFGLFVWCSGNLRRRSCRVQNATSKECKVVRQGHIHLDGNVFAVSRDTWYFVDTICQRLSMPSSISRSKAPSFTFRHLDVKS